jgi:hypothetical protein
LTSNGKNIAALVDQLQLVDPELAGLIRMIETFRDLDTVGIIRDLFADPQDDGSIAAAFQMMQAMRDLLAAEKRIFQRLRDVRGEMVACVVGARPDMRMGYLAELAGVNDSMLTKIARAHGATARTIRGRDS